MAVKKITKRWMVNNFGVILVILVALEVGFSFGIKAFYYNSVESVVLTQVNVVASQLAAYAEDSSANYSEQVRGLVEGFQARDRMELMAVGLDKKVSFTSSGFEPGGDLSMPDFDMALLSPDGIGKFVGTIDGEKIMAITKISPSVGDQQLAAMRFAVSLELVDRQIILFILVITLVCIAIIFFVIFSGSYFIGSIVNPVGEVSVTARKIAHGDFNARLTKKNDDEIGELCESIEL